MKLKLVDFPGILALVLIIASASAFAVPSNKWRIEFSGGAQSDGEIVLAVTPDGGFAQEVTVPISRTDGENEVAEKVTEALRAAAGPQYQIERDDGEDVLVKRREGAALFQVSLVRNTVEGVRVEFDAE
jgi:hypothetical protein